MNLKAILLTLMIGFDLSLHAVKLFDIVEKHPLYLHFPIFYGLISHTLFWTCFWAFGFILAFLLIFSGVKVVNKTTIKMPEQDNKRFDKIEEKLDKLDKVEK